MLCKAENRDPAHCLLEGRRVTRCAADLYVSSNLISDVHTNQNRFLIKHIQATRELFKAI